MILTVAAGKGGVGKSTIAYNLGAELEAVVVDADLGMADLPTGRGPDLHDVLAGRATAVEAVREAGPVALLPCGRSLAGARAADPTDLVGAVESVAGAYDQVVIDAPAGMRSDAGTALLAGEACLLVTDATEPAIADAIRTRELARAVETPLARIALNRADRTVPTEGIATALGGPVTRIPDSAVVARAQRAGRPVRELTPDSAAARALAKLADRLRETLA